MKFSAEVETESKLYQVPGSPAPEGSRLSWNIVVDLDKETVTKKPARGGRPSVVIIEGNQEFFWEKLDKLERARRVSREDNFVIFRKKNAEGGEVPNRVQIADDDVQKLIELGF